MTGATYHQASGKKDGDQEALIDLGGFANLLAIEFTMLTSTRVEAVMPITDAIREPKGFVHGGATLTFLETVASAGGQLIANEHGELSFGVTVDVRHCKPGVTGVLHATAVLDRVEGSKHFWRVEATDDEGDTISQGTIMTKSVTKERLAEKDRERQERRSGE